MTIAERLRRVMDENGMTFKEVAERAGMSRAHVHQIVSGINLRPNIQIVEKLAEAVGVTMAELYDDPEYRPDLERAKELLLMHADHLKTVIAKGAPPVTLENQLRLVAEFGKQYLDALLESTR